MTAASTDRATTTASNLLTRFHTVTAREAGPVLLGRLLAEHQVLPPVEIAGLSRASVFDYLLSQGYPPPELGDDQDLAGFLYLAGSIGLIFVSSDRANPVGRRRFTAAHEFGHFLLHRDRMAAGRWHDDTPTMIHEADDAETDAMEREANAFAVALLMPEGPCRIRAEAFRSQYRAAPDAVVVHRLAADFLVSKAAMRYRLHRLGVVHEPVE